jgi:hypothetical protein
MMLSMGMGSIQAAICEVDGCTSTRRSRSITPRHDRSPIGDDMAPNNNAWAKQPRNQHGNHFELIELPTCRFSSDLRGCLEWTKGWGARKWRHRCDCVRMWHSNSTLAWWPDHDKIHGSGCDLRAGVSRCTRLLPCASYVTGRRPRLPPCRVWWSIPYVLFVLTTW